MSRNTMYVNYMTKTYHNFLKSYEAGSKQAESISFADKVAEKKLEMAESAQPVVSAEELAAESAQSVVSAKELAAESAQPVVSARELTLEEYKEYIYGRISQLPVSPSQISSSFSVHISDAGFEAMQADPEYEKWVLDTLKCSLGFHNPWAGICGGSFVVHTFGATKEEYIGQSWNSGFQDGKGESLFQRESEDSFWERRVQRRKRLQEQLEELQEKRMLDKRMLGEEYVQQAYFSAELLFGGAGEPEGKS